MARGVVQLSIDLRGRDDLTAKLKGILAQLDDLSKESTKGVSWMSKAWSDLKDEIIGIPGRVTDVKSAIDMIKNAARNLWEFFDEASAGAGFSDVFMQNFANAEQLLADLTEAVQGAVSESEVMRMANRMHKVGVGAESMAAIMQAGFINAKATGQDLEDAIDNLAESSAEGSDSFKEYAGLSIDFASALEVAAKAAGKTVESFTELERRQVMTAAAAEGLAEKFGGMRLSDAALATDRLSASYDNLSDSLAESTLSLFGFNRAQGASAKTTQENAITEEVYRARNVGDLAVNLSAMYDLTTEQHRKLEAELRSHLDTDLDMRADAAAHVIRQAQRANANLARLQKEEHAQQVAGLQAEIDTELEIELSRLEAEDKANDEAAAKAKQKADARRAAGQAAAQAAQAERKAAFDRQTQEMLKEIGRSVEIAQEQYARELEMQRAAIQQEMSLMDLRVQLRKANGEELNAIEAAQFDRDREMLQIQLDSIGEITDAETTGLRMQIAEARITQAERQTIHDQRIAQLEAEAAAVMGVGAAFSEASSLASSIAPQMGAAFSALSESVGLISQSWGDMSKGAPGVIASLGKVTQSVIKNTTAQAAVRSVFELAAGFASLFFNPSEAAAHFTAAALYATLAGVSAATSNTASGTGQATSQPSQAGSSFFQSGMGGEKQAPSNVTYIIQGQLHGSLADASAQTRRMTDKAAGYGFEGAFA